MMLPKTRRIPWIVPQIVLVSLLATGCGHRADMPPTARVTGTVTLDGRPLPRGTVQFVPDSSKGTSGPSGVGSIGEDGQYEIRTAGQEGAIVGFHRVGVVAQEEVDLNTTSFAPSLIPNRYNSPSTSSLTAEVKADEDNVVDLQLTSQP